MIPDDHHRPTSNTTNIFRHYLWNSHRYFKSHNRIHFLAGHYRLDFDIIISNVQNFSILGSEKNGTILTTITCGGPAGIAVMDSSTITFTCIQLVECGNSFQYYMKSNFILPFAASFFSLNNSFVKIWQLSAFGENSGLQFINTFNVSLVKVNSNELFVEYINSRKTATFYIDHYTANTFYKISSISIAIFNTSSLYIWLYNSMFSSKNSIKLIGTLCVGYHYISIKNCTFTNITDTAVKKVNQDNSVLYFYFVGFYEDHQKHIQIVNCNFVNNFFSNGTLVHIVVENTDDDVFMTSREMKLRVVMFNCKFHHNQVNAVISLEYFDTVDQFYPIFNITNTTFINIKASSAVVRTFRVHLIFIYSTFSSIIIDYGDINIDEQFNSIISSPNKYTYVLFHDYIEISYSIAPAAVLSSLVYVRENTTININSNNFTWMFTKAIDKEYFITKQTSVAVLLRPCLLQYYSDRGNLDNEFFAGKQLNFNIIISHNRIQRLFNSKYAISHCRWNTTNVLMGDYLGSAFYHAKPRVVNKKIIQLHNNSIEGKEINRIICICANSTEYDCNIDELGPYYPGQVVSFQLYPLLSFTVSLMYDSVQINLEEGAEDACKSGNRSTQTEIEIIKCTEVKYVVSHNSGKGCNMYLKFSPLGNGNFVGYVSLVEIYSMAFYPCPKGFKLREYCQCDPVLQEFKSIITSCGINDQTILRSANSWISADTINNSHLYYVSLQCPFDYCAEEDLHLNLQFPDSQCRYNRVGVLCGQCQPGFSTTFGSSQCKQCTNIYLLIIIPIILFGVIFVMILFLLNLTVTEGDVNAFLFYINILSINTTVFFHSNNTLSIEYTLISLANLDLGIETCFYNGMNDYVRMWLSLLFPMYLIVIATILIITSRHYSRIQRLTAQKALPVLATLFLLSYTKFLLGVCRVIFFYSIVTQLPGELTTTVWAVDTSVELFGIKFIVLFVVCLALFLALLIFNAVLLFTRKLFCFKYVSRFKPLLDAYLGPYKDRFYYWSGLQLILRSLFFGLSGLERNLNLMIGSLILGIMLALHGIIQPFKSKFKNVQELVMLLNLQGLYISSLYSSSNTIAVRFLLVVAFTQFAAICILHVKKYTVAKAPRCNLVINWLDKIKQSFKKPEPFQRNVCSNELKSLVPEVAHNYKQFRNNEPLTLGD